MAAGDGEGMAGRRYKAAGGRDGVREFLFWSRGFSFFTVELEWDWAIGGE